MSRWSLLALLTVIVGGGLTIFIDRVHVRNWAFSGIRVPVGERVEVDLPGGDHLVYYESADAVPTNVVLVNMSSEHGGGVFERRATEDNEFRLLVGGWSGRAIWEINDLEPGWYTILVRNAHYEIDEKPPASDRIVFAKEPATLAEAMRTSWIIRIAGASVTLVAVSVFYTLHGRSG